MSTSTTTIQSETSVEGIDAATWFAELLEGHDFVQRKGNPYQTNNQFTHTFDKDVAVTFTHKGVPTTITFLRGYRMTVFRPFIDHKNGRIVASIETPDYQTITVYEGGKVLDRRPPTREAVSSD